MSFHRPMRIGSEPHEAPSLLWEVYVEVEVDPRLEAERLVLLKDQLWRRLRALVRRTLGPHLVGSPDADVIDVRGLGLDTPLFPLVAGGARFTCDHDVGEMIAHACRGTPLAEIVYDARGRAYELDAAPIYLRRPARDGERVAAMPDPAAYEALARRREEALNAWRSGRRRSERTGECKDEP